MESSTVFPDGGGYTTDDEGDIRIGLGSRDVIWQGWTRFSTVRWVVLFEVLVIIGAMNLVLDSANGIIGSILIRSGFIDERTGSTCIGISQLLQSKSWLLLQSGVDLVRPIKSWPRHVIEG